MINVVLPNVLKHYLFLEKHVSVWSQQIYNESWIDLLANFTENGFTLDVSQLQLFIILIVFKSS